MLNISADNCTILSKQYLNVTLGLFAVGSVSRPIRASLSPEWDLCSPPVAPRAAYLLRVVGVR